MKNRVNFIFILTATLAVTFYWLYEPHIKILGNPSFETREGTLYYKNRPFNGTTVETFPDGSTYRTIRYRKGLMHGESEEFGFTGALRYRYNYENGVKQGLQRGWYIEGPKKFEMHYKNGLIDGTTTEWYQNGRVYRNQKYINGVEVAQKVLYSTGEVFSNYVIRNNRIHGINSGQLCMDFKKDGEI